MIQDYKKLYENLIESARSNPYKGYTECHHITPRCLGGKDDENNLIRLSFKDHILAHYYLAKMTDKSKLWYALSLMVADPLLDWKQSEVDIDTLAEVRQSIKENHHPKPPNHSGFIWINDGKGATKRIPPQEEIPEGWTRGRGKKTFGVYERTPEHRIQQSIKSKQAWENPSEAVLTHNPFYKRGEDRQSAMPKWRRWGKAES